MKAAVNRKKLIDDVLRIQEFRGVSLGVLEDTKAVTAIERPASWGSGETRLKINYRAASSADIPGGLRGKFPAKESVWLLQSK